MSAAREQLARDLAAVLADPHGPAEEVTIGSVVVRTILSRPELDRSAAPGAGSEGLLVERSVLYLLPDELGSVPVPGQELVVDGVRWLVLSSPPGLVLRVELMRYLT
ncbi:MAG: hypothetical protein RBS34_02730 [Desulfofustis sp.]|jgi:hypothetical protein|nr:hypothetical protein [Desulfofustis sp.]